jgi:hypothetical protein
MTKIPAPGQLKKYVSATDRAMTGATLNEKDNIEACFNVTDLWAYEHSLSLEFSYEADLRSQIVKYKLYLPIPLMVFKYNK